jgi:hypothetical protein
MSGTEPEPRQSRTAGVTDADVTRPPTETTSKAAGCLAGFLLILAVAAVIAVLAIAWIFYDLRNGIFGGVN